MIALQQLLIKLRFASSFYSGGHEMKRLISAFVCGCLFALGLGISQMTRPPKVIGFLNVGSKEWDPSLLFVMVSAITVYLLGYYKVIPSHLREVYQNKIAPSEAIQLRTIVGAIFFGLGWGLLGLCPGPAITDLVSGKIEIPVVIAAMLAGMLPVKYYDSSNKFRKENAKIRR